MAKYSSEEILNEQKLIFKEIIDFVNEMGCDCNKFKGTATVQILREHLSLKGYNVSNRDVYIKGVPHELDLLVLRKNVNNSLIIYNPKDVIFVFEIKYNGTTDLNYLSRVYNSIIEKNNKINCTYVTILEQQSWTKRFTKETIGFDYFVLYTYRSTTRMLPEMDMGGWEKLLKYLEENQNS